MAAPPTRVVDSPRIWATLLTNTKYLSGLLTLEYSLRKVDSKYPLVVLYTSSLEPEGLQALKARNIAVREIEYLMPSAHKDYSNEVRFYDCWSKLQPFSLVEYERVVMLDSDMLVRQNMDELMDLPLDTDGRAEGKRVFAASHACVCNPLKKPHYPKDWYASACLVFNRSACLLMAWPTAQGPRELWIHVPELKPEGSSHDRRPGDLWPRYSQWRSAGRQPIQGAVRQDHRRHPEPFSHRQLRVCRPESA